MKKAVKRNVKTPGEARDRIRRMARLRKLGVPDAEIGRRFDISRNRVGIILGRKNGRTTR